MAVLKQWQGLVAILLITTLVSCGGKKGSAASFTSIESAGGGETQSFSNVGSATIQDISLSNTTSTLTFSNSQNSDYLLILNAPQQVSSSLNVQLSKPSTSALITTALNLEDPPNPEESSEDDATSQFHQSLRDMETTMAQSKDFIPMPSNKPSALKAEQSVGSVEPFNVLSTLTSVTTCETVSGVLKYASSNLYVYVDKRDVDLVAEEDLKVLASDFENIALPLERTLFGKESDVNEDGHVAILLSEVVNKQAGSIGLVTGYFFPGDTSATTSSNPCGNAREVFYGLVPDPDGNFGTPLSSSFIMKTVLPGVFAHELQHMISFNQHVLVNGGNAEEAWLNEGLSHFIEDLSGFGNENPARIKIALSQISKTSLIPSTSPTLAERGLCYLFLRRLYEKSPDGNKFIQKLYTSNATGMTNLEDAAQSTDPNFKSFSKSINDFYLTLALSETGLSTEYNFKDRTVHPQTGNYTGTCIRCDTQDGRGTVLSGPVMKTISNYDSPTTATVNGSAFFRLSNPSGDLQVSTGSSGFTGSLIRLDAK